MAFTDVFGGELIFPSQLSYNQITFSADVTLQWSREQQVGGVNVVSDFMDMDATAGSLNVDMPSASQTGEGNKATFNNIGSNSYTVRDNVGGTIQSVAPGEQWVIVLTDNTTVAGTWTTFQLGASVSVASASALAGAGLKAVSTTLNQKIDSDVEAGTPFTVIDGDRAKCLIYTAGAGTCNLTAAATLGNDWWFMLRNSGSGTLNVLPAAGLIDGVASINLDPEVSTFIFTDGTNFFTVGLSTGSIIAFDFVSVAIPGSGDFVLSGANLNRISYRFTGVLTGNRKVVVPTTTQQYWVDNQTTGAFTLEIATAGQGSPPQVEQGDTVIFYCDSTNVVNAVSATSISFPVLISQGGTGATTLGGAQTNLEITPDTRDLTAGSGMTGGGDLSADRTFNVIGGTGITANADDIELDAANEMNVAHSGVNITAGAGLTGGGTIEATRTLDVGAGTGITVNADDVALDTSNTRNVDHAAVTFTAGVGLSGGGTLAANRTFNLDIEGMAALDGKVAAADDWVINDGTSVKKMAQQDLNIPATDDSNAHTFLDADFNAVRYYTGAGGHTWTIGSGTGQDDSGILIVNSGSAKVTIAGSGVTVNSASGDLAVSSGGMAVLWRETSTVYFLSGDLES